jgi:L-lactate dehydrogenase complex protein LldG
MEESTSREKVLKRIRNALITKSSNPYPDVDMSGMIYEPVLGDLDIAFAEELKKVGGNFIFCESMDEMLSTLNLLVHTNNLQPVFCRDKNLFNLMAEAEIPVENDPTQLGNIRAGITKCEFLIARTGSIMVSSRSGPGRLINVFPDVHIVVAHSSQLVANIKNAFVALREKYPQRLPSLVSLITGPSRTADIEKTLVLGAHGPKELYLFLVEDTNTQLE